MGAERSLARQLLRDTGVGLLWATLCVLLVAIGVRSAFAATAPDFWVHMAPQKQAGLLVWSDTRQWVSEWISDGRQGATWRDPNTPNAPTGSVESFTLRAGYMMLDGYSDPNFAGVRPQWRAACLKAVLVDINSGQSTPLACDANGQVYTPFLLPRDPWRVKVWGVIAGFRLFYWEGDFSLDSVTDSCYFSGAITRDVIREREVWWDSDGGWSRGTGTPPFDAAGNPVDVTVTKQSETIIGRGEGVMGVHDLVSGRSSCLYSHWLWQ